MKGLKIDLWKEIDNGQKHMCEVCNYSISQQRVSLHRLTKKHKSKEFRK